MKIFFNFESHCVGYDPNRLVSVLPGDINTDFNIDEILQTDNINHEYYNETLKLICLGGFIKYWKGLTSIRINPYSVLTPIFSYNYQFIKYFIIYCL